MTRQYTIWFLIVSITLLIAWDVFVFLEKTPGDTISEITLFYSKYNALPFAIGVLLGHLFWPLKKRIFRVNLAIYTLIGIELIWIVCDIIGLTLGIFPYPIIVVLLGIPFGHLLWPQVNEND